MRDARGTATRERAPTIYDVAKTAGVSHTTVSRALNDQEGMTDQTRRRVLEIAARVGYERNASARVLAGRASRQLAAVVVGEGGSLRSAQLVEAVVRAARHLGYAVTMVHVDPSDERTRAAAANRIGEQGIAGAVLVLDDGLPAERMQGIMAVAPCVLIDPLAVVVGRLAGPDRVAGIALAADHLRGLGHRRIAIAVPPPDGSGAGLEPPCADARMPSLVPLAGGTSADAGWALARDADSLAGCTGLISPTVSFALGAVQALGARGVRVPEDFSVLSLEDHPDAAHLAPPLTAVSVPLEEVARHAVATLHGLIHPAAAPPTDLLLRPLLTVRASTARVPVSPSAPRR